MKPSHVYLTIILLVNYFEQSAQNNLIFDIKKSDRSYTTGDGLISNSVYGVIEDSLGFLYFFTDKGISKFDGHKFKNFTSKDGLIDPNVWLLSLDSKQRIWVHTHNNTLQYLSNDSIINFWDFDKKLYIRQVIEHSKPDQLIEFQGLLDHYFFNNSVQQPCFSKHLRTNGMYMISLKIPCYPYYYNNFVLGLTSLYDSIVLHSFDNEALTYFPADKFNYWYSPMKLNKRIFCSASNGLLIFEGKNLATRIKINSNEKINRSYVDINNNLWVCTRNNGVKCFYLDKKLKYIFKEPGNSEIKSFYFSKNLKALIYYNGKVRAGANFENLYNQNIIPMNTLKLLDWFGNSILVLGEPFNVSCIYNTKKNSFHLTDEFNRKILSTNVSLSYFPAKETKKLFEDTIIGFNHLQMVNIYANQKSGIGLKTIHQDSFQIKSVVFEKHRIYVLSSKKLYIFSRKYEKLSSIDLAKKGIITPNKLLIDSINNKLYLATESNGVYILNKDTTLSLIQSTNKIDIKEITFLKSNLVVLSNMGISIIKENCNFYSFYKSITNEQGITPEEIVGVYPHGDELIIVMPNAIHHINPDSIPNKTYNLRITEITQNNKRLTTSELNTLLPNFNPVNISMSLLDFQAAKDINYQYNLNGGVWQTIAINTLTLSNLASGSYKLNLRAINKYTNKVFDAKSLSLYVEKPWYKTTAFIIFANALLFGLALWIYKVVERKRKERDESMKALEYNLRESRIKVLENQMNPHFLFNSLTAIKSFVIGKDEKNAESYLGYFSKLMRLYLDSSRASKINIRSEIELVRHYLMLERMRFEERFEYTIDVDTEIDIDELEIPTMLIQPIVENSVRHGLFHRKEGGKLELKIEKVEHDLVITISDNGIGLAKSKALKTDTMDSHQSHATRIIQEKIDLLNQTLDYKITTTTSETNPLDPEYKGTTTIIRFNNILE